MFDVPEQADTVESVDEAVAAGTTPTLDLPASRWVDVHGPVHYREWEGSRDGPVFVLVHGLGGSLLNWALVAPGLAGRGRVLALDLAGFGLTPPAGRPAGVGSNRRVVDGFVKALDLPPVMLVGNSMGGMITLLQTAMAPESVSAMILVDPVVPRVLSADGRISFRVAVGFLATGSRRLGPRILEARARTLGPEGMVRETLAACAVDPSAIDPALVAAMVEQLAGARRPDEAMMAFVEATRSLVESHVRAGRYREMVRALEVPALVTQGALDQLVPLAAVRRAVDGHANWTLEVFPDVGHVPQMEAPERWLETVSRWLDRGPRFA